MEQELKKLEYSKEDLQAEDRGLMEDFIDRVEAEARRKGENITLPRNKRIELKSALSSPELAVLVRQTIIDRLRDTAEPIYVVSRFFDKVRITEGRSIVFPSVGAIRAHEIPEAGEYPIEYPDFQLHEASLEVKVQKVGLAIAVTDEMVEDSQWDVIGIMLKKAGEAMARHKEEKAFREFYRHGHVVFDASYVKEDGTLHDDAKPGGPMEGIAPTGLDYNGKLNGTLSVEDILDLFLAMMANNKTPTDVLMHPLVWPIFAKNEILGSLSLAAFGAPNNRIRLQPEAVQGRLPMDITVTLTPFAGFDRVDKRFNLTIIDRNEVGVMLVKTDLTTEEWDNPARDIRQIKVFERYGFGIYDDGKGIVLAKNIRFDKTWPLPERIRVIE